MNDLTIEQLTFIAAFPNILAQLNYEQIHDVQHTFNLSSPSEASPSQGTAFLKGIIDNSSALSYSEFSTAILNNQTFKTYITDHIQKACTVASLEKSHNMMGPDHTYWTWLEEQRIDQENG